MKTSIRVLVGIGSLCVISAISNAAIITFDEVVLGQTSYAYDGDSDGIGDVLFSTADELGFNTAGPGPDMQYIHEPGIEGSTTNAVDLRVDFLFGASSNITFGFALSTDEEIYGVTFELYDVADNLIASTFKAATLSGDTVFSSFPEALLRLDFEGIAAYGLFKFDAAPPRYIIDDFQGDFGSRPDEQPAVITHFEPTAAGAVVEWTPVVGLDSVVKWSSNLFVPFTDVSVVLPYPQNSYTDTVPRAGNECFYRVELVHPE